MNMWFFFHSEGQTDPPLSMTLATEIAIAFPQWTLTEIETIISNLSDPNDTDALLRVLTARAVSDAQLANFLQAETGDEAPLQHTSSLYPPLPPVSMPSSVDSHDTAFHPCPMQPAVEADDASVTGMRRRSRGGLKVPLLTKF